MAEPLLSTSTYYPLIYGPVRSRRLGQSLGINLCGSTKICSFDCVYCNLGPTEIRLNQLKSSGIFPSPKEVGNNLREKLRQISLNSEPIDHITLSGNGEPTLHPEFLSCVEEILAARADIAPHIPIVALTNGVHLDNKRVVFALNQINERFVKLDAGNELRMKSINQPLVRANLSKITSGISKLKDTTIQSLFIEGIYSNTQLSDIEDWMEIIGMIKPKAIHLMTIRPDLETPSGIASASEDTLYTIASRLKRKLQIDAQVYFE